MNYFAFLWVILHFYEEFISKSSKRKQEVLTFVVNVSSKKKAVPVATNEAADTETDDEE